MKNNLPMLAQIKGICGLQRDGDKEGHPASCKNRQTLLRAAIYTINSEHFRKTYTVATTKITGLPSRPV